MAYGDFMIAKTRTTFNLVIVEDRDLFAEVVGVQPSELLRLILKEYLTMAIAIMAHTIKSKEVKSHSNYLI